MTRDERSDHEEEDEEEEEEEGTSTEEMERKQSNHSNGSGRVVRKEGKNGRFGHLSLAETTCQAKTVYWAGGVYNKSTFGTNRNGAPMECPRTAALECIMLNV